MELKQLFNEYIGSNRGRFLGCLLAALLVWLVSLSGLGGLLEPLFYDQFLRFAVMTTAPPIRVTLVELPPRRELSDAEYTRLLDVLNTYEPAQVAFNYFPGEVSGAFYQRVRQYGNVTVGWSSPGALDKLEREKVLGGAVALPPSERGIHRRQVTHAQINGSRALALEMAILSRSSNSTLAAFDNLRDKKDYLVNFRGGAGSLPIITPDRVLKNRLEPGLIKDRFILIGRSRGSADPGLATPFTAQNRPMSLLEYQGHALNTLVNGLLIVKLEQKTKLLFFILTAVASFFFLKRLDMKTASRVTLVVIFSYLVLKYFAFVLFRLWLPVEEMIGLQLIYLPLAALRKNIDLDLAIHDILLNLNTKLRERYFPFTMFHQQESWAQVASVVTHTLSLNRLIFLERQDEDHRVKEVASFNCDFSDIDERRRDYLRVPYLGAVKTNEPVLISGERLYFRRKEDDEEQYLVPLTFADEVLGFWAFGIDPEKAREIPNFTALIRNYAFIISELLYNRMEIQKEQNLLGGMVRYLAKGQEHKTYDALKQTVELLNRQFDNLYNVFNDLNTKAIVYDLFGRVLEANKNMLDLLKSQGITPYETPMRKMLSRLTGVPAEDIEQNLKKVVLHRKPISFMIALGDKRYILNLKPLELTFRLSEFYSPAPFGIHGVVCEIVETTSLIQAHEIKEQVAEELGDLLSRELRKLLDSLTVPSKSDSAADKNRTMIQHAKEKLQLALDTIETCKRYLSQSLDALDYTVTFPLNGARSLKRAMENLAKIAKEHRVTIAVHEPQSLANVMAMPDFLRHVFEHILLVSIKNAGPGSAIAVTVTQEERWVVFHFKNKGPVMSDGELRALLFEEQENETLSREFRSLRESLKWVDAWAGTLQAGCQEGVGMEFTLRLQRFN